MSWIRKALRDRRLRFVFVGGINTVFAYLVFVVFDTLVFAEVRFGYAASLVVSYVAGMAIGFVLYRWLVFDDARSWIASLPRFVLVNIGSLFVNAMTLFLLVELANTPRLLGQAIALVLTVVLSYLGHSLFTFKKPPDRLVLRPNNPSPED